MGHCGKRGNCRSRGNDGESHFDREMEPKSELYNWELRTALRVMGRHVKTKACSVTGERVESLLARAQCYAAEEFTVQNTDLRWLTNHETGKMTLDSDTAVSSRGTMCTKQCMGPMA